MKVAALIPAYNEELTIATVLLITKKHVDDVIVVNDGSADRTSEVAALAGAKVISLEENGGKANAVMTGFSYIRSEGYDALVMLDADGQNNPDEIPVVLKPVLEGECDLSIGSRFLKDDYDIPKYRQVGQKILNGVTHASSGAKVGDSQSGFRAMNRKCLERMDMESNGFSIETDMINKAVDEGLRIKEVPISVRYDVPRPHKKNPVRHGFGVFGNIINALGYRRPLLLFGSLGGLSALMGVIVALIYVFRVDALYISILTPGWAFWSTSFMFAGFIIFVFGLMLNSQVMIKQELLRMQGKKDDKH